jgi:hypothetical protein
VVANNAIIDKKTSSDRVVLAFYALVAAKYPYKQTVVKADDDRVDG